MSIFNTGEVTTVNLQYYENEQKRGNLIYNIDANELKNVLLILVSTK